MIPGGTLIHICVPDNLPVPSKSTRIPNQLDAAGVIPTLLTHLSQGLGSTRKEALSLPFRWAALRVGPVIPCSLNGIRRGQPLETSTDLLEHCREIFWLAHLKQHGPALSVTIDANRPDFLELTLKLDGTHDFLHASNKAVPGLLCKAAEQDGRRLPLRLQPRVARSARPRGTGPAVPSSKVNMCGTCCACLAHCCSHQCKDFVMPAVEFPQQALLSRLSVGAFLVDGRLQASFPRLSRRPLLIQQAMHMV
jgi:hypothetical protein